MKITDFARESIVHLWLLVLLTIFFASSCGNTEQASQKQEMDTQKESSAENEDSLEDQRRRLFDGTMFHYDAAFLNNIIDNLKFAPDTHAVPKTDAINALLDFIIMYNNKGGDLDYVPVSIKLNSHLVSLLQEYDSNPDSGFVFHYGYNPSSKKLVYALSKGKLDDRNDSNSSNDIITYCPFDKGFDGNDTADYYLLFEQNANQINPIDESTLQTYRDDYLENLMLNRYIGDTTGEKQLWPAVDPQMIYYNPQKLWEFYREYSNLSPSDLHLYLAHGSLSKSEDLDVDSLRHSPVLFFGTSNGFFNLDDVDYGASRPFQNKAFDIGRLCPPRCGSTQPGTCP